MLFCKSSTIATLPSIALFALLVVFLFFSIPKKLKPSCDHGSMEYALQNCVTNLLTNGRFDNFNAPQVKAFCCSIAKYRICVARAVMEYCEKSINQVAFLLSTVNTTNIQYDINGYEKDHCGLHGAQFNDCAYINEVLQMALLVLAIVVVAFFFIYNIYSAVLLSDVVRNWFVAKLYGTTPDTNNIEMTTPA